MEVNFEKLVEYLAKKDIYPMSIPEICNYLGENDEEFIKNKLEEMVNEGILVKTNKKHKYTVPEKLGLKAGIFLMNQKGFGFVRTDVTGEDDVFISKKDTLNAMDKDKVLFRLVKKENENAKKEGKIVEVIQRNIETVIGRFQKQKDFGFVIPISKKITSDIFIDKRLSKDAKEGDMVECEIVQYPKKDKKAEGKIIKIIANKDDNDIYFKAIVEGAKVDMTFPKKVLNYVKKLPSEFEFKEELYKDRLDLREKYIFTIDGWDAKDLDDAISIEKEIKVLEDGATKTFYTLGVHIADVSEYVKEDSVLDNEATKRGTSIYLVNTVIPMLPEKLSNGICSLHEGVDRLTLSCIMKIDENGNLLDHDIRKSVIKSKARLVYKDVSDYLEGINEKVLENRDSILGETLKNAMELSKILREKRFNRGCMDFNFEESSIEMNEYNEVVNVSKEEIRIGNRIIEEFMLVTNETVGEHFYYLGAPFIYRVHEYPDMDKLLKLKPILEIYGYKLRINEGIHPKMLQELLNKLKGKKEESVIATLILRSLKKARYSETPLGHFSLATKFYCHFTSPIRRYPDLEIHRIIKEALDGKLVEKRIKKLEKIVKEKAVISSQREELADTLERDIDDLRKAQYMKKFVGESFTGVISSITGFGIFVRLENTVEGLIRFTQIKDDIYDLNPEIMKAKGRHGGKEFSIGDEIKVKVVRANEEFREIDFVIDEN